MSGRSFALSLFLSFVVVDENDDYDDDVTMSIL
jgi:hypothetical protein